MSLKRIVPLMIVLASLSAQAKDVQITCGGRLIDRVTANGFDRFEMAEEAPGRLVFSKVNQSLEFRAEAKYDPSDESQDIRIQVSIGHKAAVTLKRLAVGELANVMLMNDLTALTQSGRADPRFIDVDCIRVP